MATGNASFDKLITSTLQHFGFGAEIFDQVTTNNALLFMIKKRSNIKITPGGRTFTHPLRFKLNSTFKARTKLETIGTDLQDNISRAEYQIKILDGSLVLSTFELAQNAGNKEQLISLLREVKDDAVVSMDELMGDQVFNTGAGAKDFGGLQFLINDAPGSQSDVGGINPSTSGNDYWRNQTDTTAISAFNTSQAGLSAMNTLLLNATFGRMGPRAVFTTKAIYALYELGLTSNIRYTQTELADSGFVHLAYTTMPVLFDDNCPANHMYMVDTDHIWLQVLAQGNLITTKFQPSHNQLSDIALMYIFANLTAGSRRTSGVITNITG